MMLGVAAAATAAARRGLVLLCRQQPQQQLAMTTPIATTKATIIVGWQQLRPLKRSNSTSTASSSSSSSSSGGAGSDVDVENQAPQPLFLWLGGDSDSGSPTSRSCSNRRLLLPVTPPPSPILWTDSPETALQRVNEHYDAAHFVGGMGESDPGVWFASLAGDDHDDDDDDADHNSSHTYHDTLEYAALVAESIALVQLQRHGVPFGLCTTGCCDVSALSLPLTEIGLDWLHVSLLAGNPQDYQAARQTLSSLSSQPPPPPAAGGSAKKEFGQACGFIADAAEQGLHVQVALLRPFANGAARDLAHSLGAREVLVYDGPYKSEK